MKRRGCPVLSCPAAPGADPPAGLQHAIINTALGKSPALGQPFVERVARRISDHWQQLYQHPIYLLETFIEPARFRGICYRAANWLPLGLTTGRGKDDLTHQPNRSLKELWVQPWAGLSPAALPGRP